MSNRGPQRRRNGSWVRSSGGLVTALDPVMRHLDGVWISTAETEDSPDPPDVGYRQVLVRLPAAIQEAFYFDVANGVLWPALHGFPTIADIGGAPWTAYQRGNQAFADAASEAAATGARVWIHDYHLMTAPRLLRQRRPDVRIGWFNHIPWPDADHFAVLPWRREIVDSLLSADVIGFHTSSYAAHFLDCVEQIETARVDREHATVTTGRNRTRILVAPIGIPGRAIAELIASDEVLAREQRVRASLEGRRMILGVDRLDYTKGIPERLHAFARLLEQKPELRDAVVLVQVVVPSREHVPAYAELREEIDRLVGRINGRFGRTGRVPIHYNYGSLDQVELYAHYRAADVALITPLRDGMNLVALEYVASRTENDGALVLSEFAGAAERLAEAYIVNPHDIDAVARQLDRALHAPYQEHRTRMKALRATVAELDVDRWAKRFLDELLDGADRPVTGAPHRHAGTSSAL